MIQGLFGKGSTTHTLRRGLGESMEAHRAIAERIAGAVFRSGAQEGADPGGAPDLSRDMASLADEQIRYEAEAKLLRAVYDRLRSSIRG